MVVVDSTMVELGSLMPEFALRDVSTGDTIIFEDFEEAKALLVIFLSQHCPYVAHIADELGEMSNYYEGSGLKIVGIASNDVESYPEDSPENLVDMIEEYDFNFPILFDGNQDTAKDFTAACTPDFFLYDENRKLVYRGQFDDSRPGNDKKVTGKDLKDAIDAVLDGKKPKKEQKASQGCNIKWRLGNEPTYFSV